MENQKSIAIVTLKEKNTQKKEQEMIGSDTKKYHFTWRSGKYKEKLTH